VGSLLFYSTVTEESYLEMLREVVGRSGSDGVVQLTAPSPNPPDSVISRHLIFRCGA
jgi:hypothetical protein